MKFRLKAAFANLVPWPCAVLGWEAGEFLFSGDMAFFEQWLESGFQANMGFLERQRELRRSLDNVLPHAQSALVVLFPYASGHHVRGARGKKTKPAYPNHSVIPLIARYARGQNYHKVVRDSLKSIGQNLEKLVPQEFQWRATTDTVPLFDRAFARKAGLGFVGKNSLLIRPGLGSYFVIGVLLTTLPAKVWAEPVKFHPLDTLDCGTCTKCLDACPTQALVEPYKLNANRCISYLTIEHRGVVEDEFIPHFAKSMYGCDICQEVCPYQLKTNELDPVRDEKLTTPKKELLEITPKDVATMTFQQYVLWFGGSAATRARHEGLVRNALYHLYAQGDPSLEEILTYHTNHPILELEPIIEHIKKLRELL